MKPITQFERRMRLVFGLIFSVLFSTIAVSLLIISQLNESLNWVSHTHEVVAAVNATHVHFTSARVNGKNYLITRQPKYMAIRQLSVNEFDKGMSNVLALTADNPRQQKQINETWDLAKELFRMTAGYVAKLDNNKLTNEEAIAFTDIVEEDANNIITHFQMMRDEETRLLNERNKLSTSIVHQGYSVMPMMLLIQACLTGYIYYGVLDQCRSI